MGQDGEGNIIYNEVDTHDEMNRASDEDAEDATPAMTVDWQGADTWPDNLAADNTSSDALSLGGAGRRLGLLWSGAADFAGATASSFGHLAEYGWDSATGDKTGADRHYEEMEGDITQLDHGLHEIGAGMGL